MTSDAVLVPDPPPRISVVVPAFNEEHYLADALESLQRQVGAPPYEVIVVDNNSSDATAAVARRYGVTVLHEPRPGVCAARQRGTAASRGDIVVSTDADTVHPPDWLFRIDAGFLRSPEVVLVAGPCRYLEPSWWADLYPKLLFGLVAAVHSRTGRLLYVTATNTAILRTAFPGYDPALTQGGDELAVLRSMRHRGRTVWEPDNGVATSPRRLDRGLAYSIVVSLIGRYLLTYLGRRLVSGGREAANPRPHLSSTGPGPAGRPNARLRVWTSAAAAVVTALVWRR